MSDVPMTETGGSGFVSLLRQARESSGLHIAALAAALKVPVKKLEALEAGRYEELPDMTFARALASSACRQLKIDPAPVLEQIPAARGPQLGEVQPSINAPFKAPGDTLPFNPAGWLSRPAVLAAIAVLLAALVVLLMPATESPPPAEAVMPPGAGPTDAAPAENASTETVSTESATPRPSAAAADTAAPVATPAVAAPATAPVAVAAVPATTATLSVQEATTTVAATASSALLSISVTGDSWVEVVNGQGGTVVQRMLKAGDVLDFSSTPPYAVVIGRADVAKVSVRGKVMDITPYARNSVARFEVR